MTAVLQEFSTSTPNPEQMLDGHQTYPGRGKNILKYSRILKNTPDYYSTLLQNTLDYYATLLQNTLDYSRILQKILEFSRIPWKKNSVILYNSLEYCSILQRICWIVTKPTQGRDRERGWPRGRMDMSDKMDTMLDRMDKMSDRMDTMLATSTNYRLQVNINQDYCIRSFHHFHQYCIETIWFNIQNTG